MALSRVRAAQLWVGSRSSSTDLCNSFIPVCKSENGASEYEVPFFPYWNGKIGSQDRDSDAIAQRPLV